MNCVDPESDGGARLDAVFRFMVKLGVAAHDYGSSSPRVEVFLTRLAEALGYQGAFFSTPTQMIFAINPEGQPQRQHVVRLRGADLDLDKLARVGEVVDDVVAGRRSYEDASAALDAIAALPRPFGYAAQAASYALVGSGLAVLFGASWVDTVIATVLSVVVYGMVVGSARFGAVGADWLPLATALVAGFGATALKVAFPATNLVIVVLCAVIVLVPGYSVSTGIIELVGRHVVSGLANLMTGLVCLAKQILGGLLGVGLATWLLPVPSAPPAPAVPTAWLWLFMPFVILGLVVIFQTPRRDFVTATVGSLLAFVGILLGSGMADANLGNLLGTVAAVVFANFWASRTGRPTSIVLVPAIVLLVSGSIGFRGLAAIAQGDEAVGTSQFLQMFVVAATIAAGLLVGNTLVRPKVRL